MTDIPTAIEQEQVKEVNNNVEIEDIGPEPDIFDKVVNNPNYSPDRQIEDNTTKEAEQHIPEDPIEKAIRTNDPYVNIEVLPGPSQAFEPTPGPSREQEYIYPAAPSDQLDLGFVMALANNPYKALEIARNVKEVN